MRAACTLLGALLLALGACALQQLPPLSQQKPTAPSRTPNLQAFDLYPPPGSPPPPSWDLNKIFDRPMDPAMLEAAGFGDAPKKKKKPPKKKPQPDGGGGPDLAPVLAGFVAVLGVVLATGAGQ